MVCPRCAKQNEEDARFCARCGIEMATVLPPQVPEEQLYCYRHPRRSTLLSCGHCGKPICTDCAKLGPAGPRCPDCARSNVAVRPAAVVYEAKRGIVNLVGPLFRSWYGWMILLAILGALGRGCSMLVPQQPRPELRQRMESRPLPSNNEAP